jgi:hypothetical protein
MPIDHGGLSVPALILVRKPPCSTGFKTPNIKRKRHSAMFIVRIFRPILSAGVMDNERLDEFGGYLKFQW